MTRLKALLLSLFCSLIFACSSTSSPSPAKPADAGGGFDFTPSNFDLSKIDFTGVSDIVLTQDQSIRTDDGGLLSSSSGSYTYQEISQLDGPKLGVFAVKSFTIQAGVTAQATGTDALVIVALDTIDIEGKLYGNSQEQNGLIGPGVTDQGSMGNVVGVGNGGGEPGSPTSSAAGAGYCGMGGNGASSDGMPAQGGTIWGSDAITPLVPGSNGGSGGLGAGGNGGGAIQIVAANAISVGGVIHVGANGGWNAGVYDPVGNLSQHAGGGGSGGSILIEAPTVGVSGTLAANGGGGGGNKVGGDATADIQVAKGGAGDETHAAGGDGSSGAGLNGEPGSFAQASTAGGGGGAAGRIRINSRASQATIIAVLSPPLGPCATQGTF